MIFSIMTNYTYHSSWFHNYANVVDVGKFGGGVMKLTDKEVEVMVVLWDSSHPMTATEIIETSNNRTWKERSIYTILNTLIKKGAAILTSYKPTMTNAARAYAPAITSDEYMVKHILDLSENCPSPSLRSI